MSFRELHMIDVREVLRRWQAGQSARQLAREQVADRKTAGRYIAAADALGLTAETALTEEVVREVLHRVQSRPMPDPSVQWQAVATHRARIEAWLTASRR
jgi:hypothetical protein